MQTKRHLESAAMKASSARNVRDSTISAAKSSSVTPIVDASDVFFTSAIPMLPSGGMTDRNVWGNWT